MTDSQILTKAIEKAIRSGWDILGNYPEWPVWEVYERGPYLSLSKHEGPPSGFDSVTFHKSFEVPEIIFSHDFAKAFWGDKKIGHDFVNDRDILLWMSHLQQMVLEEEPLKYLEKFL